MLNSFVFYFVLLNSFRSIEMARFGRFVSLHSPTQTAPLLLSLRIGHQIVTLIGSGMVARFSHLLWNSCSETVGVIIESRPWERNHCRVQSRLSMYLLHIDYLTKLKPNICGSFLHRCPRLLPLPLRLHHRCSRRPRIYFMWHHIHRKFGNHIKVVV